MTRVFLILATLAMFVAAACTTGNDGTAGGSGVYRIRNEERVQFRMLDSVNALRQAAGSPAVQLDAMLNAAAATHSRDMAVQNRPWHFGSDGSSPLDRVARVGYTGSMLGEAISETYENELQTLTAWMENSGTRAVIMDPKAVNMGFSWYQEPTGKIWWTLVMAN
ncbi:CAP domain-containing protein [Phaeobacter sp. B1627]|uniref:CAP domain-containing protein n=1 Tax=Phaeobacter sp. B1627 TaxID=2583809 RepID=UPI00111AA83F|nr:CAP domain-containing protein [Phaeobacter sp. B1627]TNJ45556.1 CAP domain-containing protein [Phaeobacter sp. B1627]